MTMKLRKISETAYREPPAGGMGKKFNYAKAFLLFGIVLAVLLVLGVLVANHISGRVSTTEAWVEPLEEINYEAESNVRIVALNVKDGQIITQADIDQAIKENGTPGFLLYETNSDSDSVGEGEIEKQHSIIAQRQTDLMLIRSGADVGYAGDNKIVREYRAAADKLAEARKVEKLAQTDYEITHEEFLRAEEFFADRLTTVDTLNDAMGRDKKAKATLESAKESRERAQDRYDECKAALDAAKKETIMSRAEDVSPEEREKAESLATPEEIHEFIIDVYEERVKQAQAEIKSLKAKYGIRSYYTKKPGRVFALKVQEGNRITKGDSILKIFNPNSIEIVARMDGKLARDVKNGQEADITLTIGSKVITLTGKVRSIANPIFERSKKDRDRLRTEFTNVDFGMREVHIEFDIEQLTDEDLKALAPGNSAKVTIHTN